MSHHEDDKKKKVRERNRKMWQIFTQIDEMRSRVNVAAAVTDRKPDAKGGKDASEAVSMHMVSIRNRLDGSRRKSEDRWNRFAGTSGGGGKGR